jgi:hypothetical protein
MVSAEQAGVMEVVMGKFYCSKSLVVRRWPLANTLEVSVFRKRQVTGGLQTSVFNDLSSSYCSMAIQMRE